MLGYASFPPLPVPAESESKKSLAPLSKPLYEKGFVYKVHVLPGLQMYGKMKFYLFIHF